MSTSLGPKRPQTLHADGIHGSIQLTWTSPVTSVLNIDEYLIEVSIDGKIFKDLIKEIPPDILKYSITNAIENVTYRFKIYSICNKEKSHATEETFYTGGRFSYFIVSILSLINNKMSQS